MHCCFKDSGKFKLKVKGFLKSSQLAKSVQEDNEEDYSVV